MMFLSHNWYFLVQKALIYYTVNKSHHNSFILLVFSPVANFRYVANFRFLTLNISKMLVILNYVDYMKEPIGRINNGEKDINVKHHIGAGYHISCNSPYKNVGIRLWEKSLRGKIFPTQKGISLKFPEWTELLRVFQEIFLTHQEIYTASSCLLDKDKPNHDASQCQECISMETPALGRSI